MLQWRKELQQKLEDDEEVHQKQLTDRQKEDEQKQVAADESRHTKLGRKYRGGAYSLQGVRADTESASPNTESAS